jgi:hypothetical protein
VARAAAAPPRAPVPALVELGRREIDRGRRAGGSISVDEVP